MQALPYWETTTSRYVKRCYDFLGEIYPLVFLILLYKSLMVVVVVGVGDKWIYLDTSWRMPQLGCALVNYSDMGGVSS